MRIINVRLYQSVKDETLLKRVFKVMSKVAEIRETIPAPTHVHSSKHPRNLDLEKLEIIIKKHIEDPLFYSAYFLSRTYNIDENILSNVLGYVKPLVYFANNKQDGFVQFIKTAYVRDVSTFNGPSANNSTYARMKFISKPDSLKNTTNKYEEIS